MMKSSVMIIAPGSITTFIVSLGRLLMRHKHPRTMQEAFGPYTDEYIYDDDPAESWMFWLAVSVTVLLATLIVWLLLVC
jgi:hypothetical protein